MATPVSILIIVTAHAALGSTGQSTGLWLEEFTTPYYEFVEANAKITVASLPGGQIPLDPHSVRDAGANPPSVERFLKDSTAQQFLKASVPLSQLSPQGWDIVFVPGGHGAMWDLASSEDLGRFLSEAWKDNAILGSVCHGPAAFVNAKDVNGEPLVKGKIVNAFTDSEEAAMRLTTTVPFKLETKLRSLGAQFVRGADFTANVAEDGRLITGQNPMSSALVAQALLKAVTTYRQHN